MNTVLARVALLTVALSALAACADGPYQTALDARVAPRPAAPPTKADVAARAPYDNAPYFKTN